MASAVYVGKKGDAGRQQKIVGSTGTRGLKGASADRSHGPASHLLAKHITYVGVCGKHVERWGPGGGEHG